MTVPLNMLTFSPMIDSETIRLLLTHYTLPYQEERHLLPWVAVLSLFRNGSVRVPFVRGPDTKVAGPEGLYGRYDTVVAPELRLIPTDPSARIRVQAGWTKYNGDLASNTAVYAYYTLLPHRDIMIEPFSRGIPPCEAAALRSWGYAPMRWFLSLALGLSAKNAAAALATVRGILDETDKLFADGRPYVDGDALTLADIALAASTGPLVLPSGYGAPMPPVASLPPDYVTVLNETRARPTGQFVERFYATHRPPVFQNQA